MAVAWELDSFLGSLTAAAPATIDAYRRDLVDFTRWATDRQVSGPADVDRRVLRQYLVHLGDRSAAPRTIARRTSALRRYFRWAARTGRLAADPSLTIRAPRGTGRLPRSLHDDQLQHRPMARPWFAQWWIILPFVIMGTRGIWWIIPMVALWIWVIWPAIEQNRQRQQVAAAPMRPLTLEERDQVLFALRTGSETAAIKRYRELTGADLYTATMTVKAMQRELGR